MACGDALKEYKARRNFALTPEPSDGIEDGREGGREGGGEGGGEADGPGGADHVVSAHNGHAAVRVWADTAGARAGASRAVQRGKRRPMIVTDFKHRRSTVSTLVEVGRLGHAWSDGAATQSFSDGQGPDASRMAWAFAARQFRAGVNSYPQSG